jgi:hypothetical protein
MNSIHPSLLNDLVYLFYLQHSCTLVQWFFTKQRSSGIVLNGFFNLKLGCQSYFYKFNQFEMDNVEYSISKLRLVVNLINSSQTNQN